jgi:hypothetical protein
MKKSIISGAIISVLGLLIALGPQFLFRVCSTSCSCCGDIPTCHWTAQAEIGLGLLIAALGLCFIVFNDSKTQFGLSIGVFFSGIIALFIPHGLIGGCEEKSMACHRVAFPAITVLCAVLIIGTALYVYFTEIKKSPAVNTGN